eukprot:gene5841-biopygen5016
MDARVAVLPSDQHHLQTDTAHWCPQQLLRQS